MTRIVFGLSFLAYCGMRFQSRLVLREGPTAVRSGNPLDALERQV
jgi:hypothetical protein